MRNPEAQDIDIGSIGKFEEVHSGFKFRRFDGYILISLIIISWTG